MLKLFQPLGFACLGAAMFLAASPAHSSPTYALGTSYDYAWETSANVLAPGSFQGVAGSPTCTDAPVDDDEAYLPFTGGFSFPFAGSSYAAVRMLSDGRLQFGPSTGAFRNNARGSLPEGAPPAYAANPACAAAAPGPIMNVAWMALSPSLGGSMSWEIKGAAPNRRAVYTWDSVPLASGSGSATFQAILYENGRAAYQYKSLTGGGSWSSVATTGVQASPTNYAATTNASNNSRIDIGQFVSLASLPASTTGSTCAPMLYTVTAQDAGGATLSSYVGNIELRIASGEGYFTLASGNGVFSANSGGSTSKYQFSPADNGVVQFYYHTALAEQTILGFFDDYVSIASPGKTVRFADNAFVVAAADPAGANVVAGRPHAMTATLYAKDSSGTCGVATSYFNSFQDIWYSPTSSHPAGAIPPKVSANSSCSNAIALPSAAPAISKGSNNGSLAFSAGVANFYLCTSDVGQYSISIRDDTGYYMNNPSITSVIGSSGPLTARPFGLWVDSARSTAASFPNPGGTAALGSPFIAAGKSFTTRITARGWAAGQDSVTPGAPDSTADLSANAILPSFAANGAISIASFTPASGAAGVLNGSTFLASAFSGGAASATLTYSEAGSIKLLATAPSYLGSPSAVPGAPSAPIGRFIPDSIILSASSLAPACSAGGFTYMDQPFSVTATLAALGSAGNYLRNYDSSLGYAFSFQPAWRAVDSANGLDLASRTNLNAIAKPAWTSGRWSFASPFATFSRLSSGHDGSYESLQLGISGADADGVPISGLNASYSASGSCGALCNMKSIGGPAKMRHGRLEVLNVFGAVTPTLNVPVQAMYWARNASGALGWTPNTLDSCTSIARAAIRVGGLTGSVASATIPAAPASIKLSGGKAIIPVTRSGGANSSGSALLGINLAASATFTDGGCFGQANPFPAFGAGAGYPYLKSEFCGVANGNPAAKIVWGAPSAKSGSIVFSRESY